MHQPRSQRHDIHSHSACTHPYTHPPHTLPPTHTRTHPRTHAPILAESVNENERESLRARARARESQRERQREKERDLPGAWGHPRTSIHAQDWLLGTTLLHRGPLVARARPAPIEIAVWAALPAWAFSRDGHARPGGKC